MKFGEFSGNILKTMIILFSALTLCLVAVLAFTAEARYAKKTRTRGNAKMLSLIEKMRVNTRMNLILMKMMKHVKAPEGTQVNHLLMKLHVRDDDYCPGMLCPGDWCCDDTDLTCCDEDSDMICVPDAQEC